MRPLSVVALLALGAPILGQDVQLERQQARWRLGFESLDAGGRDDVGLLTVHYDLLGISRAYPPLYAGVGAATGITGDSNGFLLGGLTVGANWSPAPLWSLDTGLFAGVGGPSARPDRRGYALRPFVAVERFLGLYALRGEIGYFGLQGIDEDWTLSLGVSLPSELLSARAGRSSRTIPGDALVARTSRLSVRYLELDPRGASRKVDGRPMPHEERLVGVGLDTFLTPHVYLPVAVFGAVDGSAPGFILAALGLGSSIPLTRATTLEAKLSALSGGGGGIDTGSGLGWHASGGVRTQLTHRIALELLAGRADFPSGHFEADTLALALSWSGRPVELARDYPRAELGHEGLSTEDAWIQDTRWSLSTKFLSPDGTVTKRSGEKHENTLSLAGVGVEVPIDRAVSLTARAFGAWSGDVGGYSEGLVGARVGYTPPRALRHRFGLVGELGAAGGGDVDVKGGLLFSFGVSWQYRLTESAYLTAEVGQEQASRGGFEAETLTLGLSWSLPRAVFR